MQRLIALNYQTNTVAYKFGNYLPQAKPLVCKEYADE
jgi:hypothetical protein